MIQAVKKLFSLPELKQKIFFTFALLIVCRVGAYIPVPGVHADVAISFFKQMSGGVQNLFQMMDIFSGGAFAQMTVTALGVMPYISASIILQLLMAVLPSLQREVRESPDQGRKKLGKWTRIGTLFLALFQSAIFARYVLQMNKATPGLIVDQVLQVQLMGFPWLFYLLFMTTMTTGTLFLMWIGEQISERGIGNGISLIITIGILSSFPSTIGSIMEKLNVDTQEIGQLSLFSLSLLLMIFVITIIGTILIIQGERKIPLQHARRIVGRREMQGSSSFIPLKVNYSGVIPVIFASQFLLLIATVIQFAGKNPYFSSASTWFTPGSTLHLSLYVLLIVFFTYFWTATQFRPDQIASDMKKSGAFIPGVRQGKPTQEFLETTMNRITLAGAVFLALIAILPTLLGRFLQIDAHITQFFGGTSLLILVGVILDTMKQIDSHLIMKRYDGFMKVSKSYKK